MSTKRPRNFDSTKTLQPFPDIEEFLKLSHPDQNIKFNQDEKIKIEAKQNISIPKIVPVDESHLLSRFNDKDVIEKKIKHQLGYVRILHEQIVPKPKTYELTDKDKKYFDEYVLAKRENANLKSSDFENLIAFFEETSGKSEIAKIEKIKEQFLLQEQTPLKNIFSLQQLEELYGYWASRRQFFKRPLLRSLQAAIPGQDDNNYHLAFRPQPTSNEKMKTRKQTDQDNVQKKFQQLVDEFKQHNLLIQCINTREQLKYNVAIDFNEKFTDQIYKIDKNANFKYQGLFECNNVKEYEDKKKELKKFKAQDVLNLSKKTNKEVTEFLRVRGKIPTIQQQQQEKLLQQQQIQQLQQEQIKPEPKIEVKPEIKPEPIIIPPIIKPKTPSPKKISPQEELLREQNYIVAQFVSSLYMESKKYDIQPRDLEPQNLEKIIKKIQDLRPQPKPQPQAPINQPQRHIQTPQQTRVDDTKQIEKLFKPLKNYKKYIEEKKKQIQQQADPQNQQQDQRKNFINFHIYKVMGRQGQPYIQRTFEKVQHRDNNFYQIQQKERSLEEIIKTQIQKDNFQPKKELFKTMHIENKLKNIIQNIRYDTFDEDNNIFSLEEKESENEKKEEENFFENVKQNLMKLKQQQDIQKQEEAKNNALQEKQVSDFSQKQNFNKNNLNQSQLSNKSYNNNNSYPNSNTNSSQLHHQNLNQVPNQQQQQFNSNNTKFQQQSQGQGKFPLNIQQSTEYNGLKLSSINNNQGKQGYIMENNNNNNINTNQDPYYQNQGNLKQIEKENSNYSYQNQEPIQNTIYDKGDQFYNN